MNYCIVCPDCGHKETFYTLEEQTDAFCSNCGAIVKIPSGRVAGEVK